MHAPILEGGQFAPATGQIRALTNARERTTVLPKRRSPRGFGLVRKLPSGRFQASYLSPSKERVTAPATFGTRQDADGWLSKQRTKLDAGTWRDPKFGTELFGSYAIRWLTERDLKPRTRVEYQRLLDAHLIPAFGGRELKSITPARVKTWYASLDASTQRARTYSLLKTIAKSAVDDDLVTASPCRIRKAGQSKRRIKIMPATLPELEAVTAAMPERLQLMVLLAAWCGMRYGELVELRRRDVDLLRGKVKITRAVTRVKDSWVVGDPKSDAGVRDVSIPPHLLGLVEAHLAEHVPAGRDALLFPGVRGGYLSPASLYDAYYPARTAAGRPDLRFHDLRHTGATLAAATGATLADLMARLGHSTPGAAMRYQYAVQDRDAAIAAALSGLHTAQAVTLRPKESA